MSYLFGFSGRLSRSGYILLSSIMSISYVLIAAYLATFQLRGEQQMVVEALAFADAINEKALPLILIVGYLSLSFGIRRLRDTGAPTVLYGIFIVITVLPGVLFYEGNSAYQAARVLATLFTFYLCVAAPAPDGPTLANSASDKAIPPVDTGSTAGAFPETPEEFQMRIQQIKQAEERIAKTAKRAPEAVAPTRGRPRPTAMANGQKPLFGSG